MEQNQQNAGGHQNQPQKNTGMAVVAYILFFIPLLTGAKNDPFVKFHVKQGLALFIAGFIIWIISFIPFLSFIWWILEIGLVIELIIGIVNALNGKQKPLPVIGEFGKNFKF